MKKKRLLCAAVILLLLLLSVLLLKEDSVPFLKWWALSLALGIAFFPLTQILFREFTDRGYLFAKVLGIGVTGYVFWALVCAGIMPFRAAFGWVTAAACTGLVWLGVWVWKRRRAGAALSGKTEKEAPGRHPGTDWGLILMEELLFLFFFLMWMYFSGFRPEASGTEKFMDYGFMASMMRSDTLPSADIWYSQSPINYYYGGQYYAVYLTKLSFTRVQETYHLMRALVASFAFVLPFSIAYRLLWDVMKKSLRRLKRLIPALGGLLAGVAVSFGGNMHYVYYGKLRPILANLFGWEQVDYWFPNSTRYIGYNPDVPDKTIHEFPSYSFVLGDLHAHMVNLFLVLALLGILYAFLTAVRRQKPRMDFSAQGLLRQLLNPYIVLAGWFLGVYQWTNYWDFVIYCVVCFGAVLYASLYRTNCRVRPALLSSAVWAAELLVLAFAAALPFSMSFETMVSGVGIAQNHSMFHQLLLLWGLPALLSVIFWVFLLLRSGRKRRSILRRTEEDSAPCPGAVRYFFMKSELSDIVILIWSLCAFGLIVIPELVYVRDIYENGYARSNTMFKLTYQAFVMFGVSMAYILVRFLALKKSAGLKAAAGIGLACLLGTCCYTVTAVNSWFGNVLDPSGYQGLDATAFLESSYPEDAPAIRALEEDAENHPEFGTNPVILEADGDSYSDYCRVSAMTGLPTVFGWYVHEWLWRGDPGDLNEKSEEITRFYTTADTEETQEFLEKCEIRYIFIGSCEREKYGSALDETRLRALGTVIYDGESVVIRIDS